MDTRGKRITKNSRKQQKFDYVLSKLEDKNETELCIFFEKQVSLHSIHSNNQNLDTLTIVGQPTVTSLNGISKLCRLRELWVIECRVKDLTDLEKCSQLEKLYLYSNEIETIPNMSNNPHLKLLSVSGNNISLLTNLDSMLELQEINLARNKIKIIGDAFSHNAALSVVNLAGNMLYKLKDVRNLASLANLKVLTLSDPLYGECPVTSVCNYRYDVICNLTGLVELDYYGISFEERIHVADFFKTRTMFYNMLWHKQLNIYRRSFDEHQRCYIQRINDYRQKIFHAMRLQASKNEGCNVESSKLPALRSLQEILSSLDAFDGLEEQWERNVILRLKILQGQLCLKRQQSGNVVLTDYESDDKSIIMKLCQNICSESLCSNAKEHLQISRIHVHRATNVINNETAALRRFQCLENIRTTGKQESEVLFKFLVTPVGVVDVEMWPFDLVENECFAEQEVVVTDCLASADAHWLSTFTASDRSFIPFGKFNTHRLAILVQVPSSALMIKLKNPDNYHAKLPDYKDTCGHFSLINVGDAKLCFIIEYEYVLHHLVSGDNLLDSISEKIYLQTGQPENLGEWSCIDSGNLPICLGLTEVQVYNLRRINLSNRKISAINVTTFLPNLKELDLSHNELTSLPTSPMIDYVQNLDISFNDLQFLIIFTSLPTLTDLNVAWNRIANLESLLLTLKISTPNLVRLNINYNPFSDLTRRNSVVSLVRKIIPALKYLNGKFVGKFQRKPDDDFSDLREISERSKPIKFKSPTNAPPVLISDPNSYLSALPTVLESESKNICYLNLSDNKFNNLEFATHFPQLEELCLSNNLCKTIGLEKPMWNLIKINLSGNLLSTIEGLTQQCLPVLQYLDLCENFVESLTAMGSYHSISEFYCAHNRISKMTEISNVISWKGLRIIDLSNNPIESSSVCMKFTVFHLPKIEYVNGQCITGKDIIDANNMFAGLLDKHSLMSIRDAGDFSKLKQLNIIGQAINKINLSSELLPHLESLDLRRNKITTLSGLHNLQRLRTLCLSNNRVERFSPIDQNMQTLETFFPNTTTLYLDHNRIRSLRHLELHNMPALKHLYLQNNELEDINGIEGCTAMETLIVDQNKIQMMSEKNFHMDNNIRALFMENNKIKSLRFSKRLSNIQRLFIANNKIGDKNALEELCILPNLNEITILGNPLCKKMNHYSVAIRMLVKLKRLDGHSVALQEYLDKG